MTDLTAYKRPLAAFPSLKYLIWVLLESNGDWLEVVHNLSKLWSKSVQLPRVMVREGLDARTLVMFYVTVFSGTNYLQVGDFGYVPAHWQNSGQVPSSGGLHTYGTEAKEAAGWDVVLPPSGGSDGGVGHTRGGVICCPPPEHIHYGPVSVGVMEPGKKGVKIVVVSGVLGPRGDKYGVSDGRIGVGGEVGRGGRGRDG